MYLPYEIDVVTKIKHVKYKSTDHSVSHSVNQFSKKCIMRKAMMNTLRLVPRRISTACRLQNALYYKVVVVLLTFSSDFNFQVEESLVYLNLHEIKLTWV